VVRIPQHVAQLRRHLPALLEDDGHELTSSTRCLFHSLYEELVELETKITSADERIDRAFRENAECQRIAAVEGIGPVTATAVVAAISDGRAFRNGRQFAAWLGLVPRQHSSGGRARLLGISKRGDPYLRTLLVHGARSVVYRAKFKTDRRSCWINDKQQRLGNGKGLCRSRQQERAHSLVADGEATGVSARCLGSAVELRCPQTRCLSRT
jgi:transposase